MINPKEMLETLVDHLAVTAQVQNVFGEPIEAHGKTVVPIARVSYCLGAGGGGGAEAESEKTERRRRRWRDGESPTGRRAGNYRGWRALCRRLRSTPGCRIRRRRDRDRPAAAPRLAVEALRQQEPNELLLSFRRLHRSRITSKLVQP